MSVKRNSNLLKIKKYWKKAKHFLNEDDSFLSLAVNIVLAFILIRFIVYPGLGFVLSTDYPIVAVVSGSMEHKMVHPCSLKNSYGLCIKTNPETYEICGKQFESKQSSNFDNYWTNCGSWYALVNLSKDDFSKFPYKNGFNTGDIMILKGTSAKNIEIGDVIVFQSTRPDPIIHRVIEKNIKDGKVYFRTKGDHNPTSYPFEAEISEDYLLGKAVFRIPFLGYLKIWLVKIFYCVFNLKVCLA